MENTVLDNRRISELQSNLSMLHRMVVRIIQGVRTPQDMHDECSNDYLKITSHEGCLGLSHSDNNMLLVATNFLRTLSLETRHVCYHTPETKHASMEWKHSGSPQSKKLKVVKCAGTVMATVL